MSQMYATATTVTRPRFGKIETAMAYSGRSRSRLYQLAVQHHGLFVKDGSSTLVDFNKLDEILDALPAAEIRLPHLSKARAR